MSAPKKTAFTKHDKAYYADANTVNFVRPGLTITIVSAKIANDGTISVDYKLADPKGLPLDLAGVTNTGRCLGEFLAGVYSQGRNTVLFLCHPRPDQPDHQTSRRLRPAPIPAAPPRPSPIGEYVYTFKTKAVAKGGGAFDPTATHRVGVYGSRNLTEFDLGTNYDSETLTSSRTAAKSPPPAKSSRTRPATSATTTSRSTADRARASSSASCATPPQTADPDTGNTVDMKVFIHKIHMGSQLPSVKAGKPYQVIGFNQGVSDWSTVEPAVRPAPLRVLPRARTPAPPRPMPGSRTRTAPPAAPAMTT